MFRPVFSCAAAAGVYGKNGDCVFRVERLVRDGNAQSGNRVRVVKAKAPEWFEKRYCCVLRGAFVGPMAPAQIGCLRKPPDIFLEYGFWIVNVRNDQIEPVEELRHGIWERAAFDEHVAQQERLDCVNSVGKTASNGQFGYVRVSENIDRCFREAFAKCGQHRQGQNEIADCAASDNKYSHWRVLQLHELIMPSSAPAFKSFASLRGDG